MVGSGHRVNYACVHAVNKKKVCCGCVKTGRWIVWWHVYLRVEVSERGRQADYHRSSSDSNWRRWIRMDCRYSFTIEVSMASSFHQNSSCLLTVRRQMYFIYTEGGRFAAKFNKRMKLNFTGITFNCILIAVEILSLGALKVESPMSGNLVHDVLISLRYKSSGIP